MNTFKTNYNTPGLLDINGAQNFMKALNRVMEHISDKAIRKDNALYVNASELMEICNNTMTELHDMIEKQLTGDGLKNTILNIIKKDALDNYGIDLDKPKNE